jgi:pilus assembly protein Flp/PilA
MGTLWNKSLEFLKREDGPTAVEYAVMLALIIAVCFAAITALGSNTNKTFTSVSDEIDEALERAGGS